MDIAKLILTEPVSPPTQLEHLDKSKLNGATDEKKKQIAKDFESVLLNKLFDQMSKSVGNWALTRTGLQNRSREYSGSTLPAILQTTEEWGCGKTSTSP